jgi:hypothetical protein
VTDFYDSARWGLIPAGARAMLYVDGRYAATPADAKRFSAVRWITIAGGASSAAKAGAIDYEPGNLAFEGNQLREFAVARRAMNCRARVYCNLTDLPSAHSKASDLSNVVWWLATLDGHPANVAEMVTAARGRDVKLAPGQLWANQYAGGPAAAYDTSVLLGVW